MTGVKFLVRVTLRRLDPAAEIYHLREPQKIPQVMSPDETRRLLAVASSLKGSRVAQSRLWLWPARRRGGAAEPRCRPQLWPALGQIPRAERAAPPNPYPSPRFRALALFGRRSSRRVDKPVMPASENLHNNGLRCTSAAPAARRRGAHSSGKPDLQECASRASQVCGASKGRGLPRPSCLP